MDFSLLFLWFLFAWVCYYVLTYATSKLPPGPFPIPIVGSLFNLGSKPHESLAKLAKTYGSLMAIKLGSVTTIVVSSPAMAKEILQTHDQFFAARMVPDAVRIHNQHEASMIFLPSSSPHWRNVRKLCNSQMFTSQRINDNEKIREMKVNDLVDHIRKVESRCAVNIAQLVFSTTLNLISNTLFSVDLADFNSSESSQEFKALVWGCMEEIGRPNNLADYFPLLRRFDLQSIRRRTAIYFEKLDKLFDSLIDDRLQSQEESAPNDLLNRLLFHTEENGCKLDRTEIKILLKELFIAGTDTSAGTLEWAMTELLRHPDVLTKAKLELKEKLEANKPIEESDIARLPYLQAIVKETLRLHPAAPLSVPHRAEMDIEICGFNIPKHAKVLVNVWAIGRDPDLWSNPNSFIPDRFLGSNVDFKGRDFELIPFGSGRRICPGMSLAYRMVHLMLGSLIQSFGWELEDGMKPEDIDMDDKFGITLQKLKPLHAVPFPSEN
ncbi:unspecific monooxygenase [Ranunculus cassubicifolius]